MKKPMEKEETLLQDGTIAKQVLLNQKTMFLVDVNVHLLHSDMSRYFIEKEHTSV